MHMIKPERLIEALMRADMAQAELARRVGISATAINSIIHRGSGSKHLHQIARELGTTPEYLIGEIDDPSLDAVPSARTKGASPSREDLDSLPIPMLDLGYGMGGSFVDGPVEATVEYFPRAMIRAFTRAPAEKLCWAQGIGDSMEPTIHDSDMLLIDLSQDALRLNDKVWALAEGDIGMVKRLRVHAGQLEIMSDNADVPNYTVDPDDVRIIGQVVAKIGRL